jgi:serine/threonine protein kinase
MKSSARSTAFFLERIRPKLQALPVVSTDGCLTDESIFAFVQGQLPPEAVPTIEEHLSLCQDCRTVVAETAKFFAHDDATVEVGRHDDDRPAPLVPGTRVSRYVISEVIGVGAAGVVYRAYDPELKRNIALKLLRTDHARELGPLKARLLREAQAMAQLAHPNVVSVFDVGTYADEIVIVLEMVEGQTLARWLGERPRTWQEVRSAFIEAGKGLAAAHAVQLVHRDFKPANVLVGADGRVRVTDFGLARPMDLDDELNGDAPADSQDPPSSPHSTSSGVPLARRPLFSLTATEEGGLAGTPVYMAPEQFQRRRADARSDQFSFCVALYMALYRRHPYLVGSTKVYSLEQLADSVINGSLQVPERSEAPAALLQILRRGLKVDPKERFSSMQELLDNLMSDPAMQAPARASKQRGPIIVVGAAVTAVIGASFLAMSVSGREPAPIATQALAGPASPTASAVPSAIVEAPEPPAPTTPASSPVAPVRRARPAHTQDTKAHRPPPPPGRERYVDGLKDPF